MANKTVKGKTFKRFETDTELKHRIGLLSYELKRYGETLDEWADRMGKPRKLIEVDA